MTENVVGRKKATYGTPPAPSTPSTTPSPAPTPVNAITKANEKLGALGIPGLNPDATAAVSSAEEYTPAQLTQIGLILKKLNYSVKNTAASVKTLLATDPDLIQLTQSSKTYADLITTLNNQYLPGLDTTQAKTNYPSRNVYQYKPEDVYAIANTAYQNALGRDATEEEKKKTYASLLPQINAGTVSVSKDVLNKKTGKMETVTTQTPAFSQASATAEIEKKLKAANPEAYNRNKALKFSSELNSILAGGM